MEWFVKEAAEMPAWKWLSAKVGYHVKQSGVK